MKKLKLFIFTLLSVLTLGLFVVTGSKVEAGANYADFQVSFNASGQTYKIGDEDQVTSSKYDDNTTSVTSNFKAAGTFCNGKVSNASSSSNMKCEANGLKFQKTDCELSFIVAEEAESIEIKLYIGKNTDSRSLSIYNGSTLLDTMTSSADDNTISTFTYTDAGTYKIKANIDKAHYIQSIKVVYKAAEDTRTNEEKAVDAIDKIGIVAYTDKCRGLIATAAAAIEACDEENRNSTAISNYNVYTTAVSTFNGLVNAAVSNFTTSVESIGTVTSTSKATIDLAYEAYDALLDTEKALSNVTTSYATLNSKEEEYIISYTEKVTTLLTSDVIDSYKTNQAFTGEKILYTDTNSSIFSATKGVQMDKGNSKTYNSVTYNDRFKTGGVMSAASGVVSCALKVEAPSAGIVKLIGVSGTSNCTRNIKVSQLVNNELVTVLDYGNIIAPSTANEYIVSIPSAGTYYIGSDSVKNESSDIKPGTINFFKMTFTTAQNTGVSATTAGFQNSTKDSLRIVGTISGVTNTANIKSIELVLLKDGVATKNQIFLTNVYTSITGVNGFGEVTNTYYVVFKITGITSSVMPNNTEISHKLKVTFTDDSYVESTVNVSTWNN